MASNTKVFLIGAGPGDPGLFTLKGKECMQDAEVIIYDYLANRRLLEYANPDAELIFVGKKGFTAHVTQEEINAIIVEKAKQDGVSKVARLKGGDPFVFGRGGEEALALAAEGIAFEVVPGVTSGVAAPAYAGIPVTHRKVASSMALITGHEDPTKDESAIDWKHLAHGIDTLCFYMGIKSLHLITAKLIENGKPADTPVALVRWGTTPAQEVLVSNLGEVAEEARKVSFQAPAIIVVGNVVALREQIAWFEKDKPLLGQKIVVTRSRTQAGALSKVLEDKGAEVFEFPTIKIVDPDSFEVLDDAIADLGSYSWAIFTSVNGVEGFFSRLGLTGKDSRSLGGVKVAAIGPATADKVREYGIVADIVPGEYKAEGVLEALEGAGVKAGDKVLLARATEAREVLPEGLAAAGVEVTVASVYKTVVENENAVDDLVERLQGAMIDTITFASSSTVSNFMAILAGKVGEQEALRLMAQTTVASIGPITTDTARKLGLDVKIEAQEYTIAGLVRALVDDLRGTTL
ncbi:MAG TPA: uroporphyrinogen-III C-methyltransferase [Coriobacteriia bacterium]|nr:uroporphyrinogen-III C-methyltransferase [Coriobacteriia bacterium]